MARTRLTSSSSALHERLWQHLGEPFMPPDDRSKLAGGVFRFVIDCHSAMILMTTKHLDGPAFSLVRPICEALATGYWIHYCATEERLCQIIEDPHTRGFPKNLINDIKQSSNFTEGRFLHLKEFLCNHMGEADGDDKELARKSKMVWKAMNSYTHASYSMIVDYLSGDAIESNFDCDAINEVIRFTDACTCWAVIGVCEIAGERTKADELYAEILLSTLQT